MKWAPPKNLKNFINLQIFQIFFRWAVYMNFYKKLTSNSHKDHFQPFVNIRWFFGASSFYFRG